jgi:hypothetical protein
VAQPDEVNADLKPRAPIYRSLRGLTFPVNGVSLPKAHEGFMKTMGIITGWDVNDGNFAEPKKEFLKFLRTNIFLKKSP